VKRSIGRSLLASVVAVLALLVTPGMASAIDFFSIPTPCSNGPNPPGGTCQPGGITTGPDGNVWFTEENGNRIGRVNPGGSITEFQLASGSSPVEIVSAGGALWFTQLGRNKIGTITTAGAVTEYPSSNLDAPADGITVGPDGHLWFTEFSTAGTSRIGHMTTGGTLLHQFQLPSGSGPGDITVGPDNRLWFTQSNGRIGAIPYTSTATNGSDVVDYPSAGGLSDPAGITASGTGLWFTEATANRITRIEVTGTIGAPTAVGAGPSAIATGADGHLWFTEEVAGKIGRITPSGVLTNEFPTSSASSAPAGITAGPGGTLWFTETVGNNIGRIATGSGVVPPPPPPPPPLAPAAKSAKKCKVPKLRRLTIKKARKKLKKAGCKFKIRGKGRVRSTVPKAGRTTTKRVIVKCKGKSKKARRR
jgi:streptogramin lyase